MPTTTTTTSAPPTYYPYNGTDCNGNALTIFTANFEVFDYLDTAYSDVVGGSLFSGFFIYNGTDTYYYANGIGSISSCPTTTTTTTTTTTLPPWYPYTGVNCGQTPTVIYTASVSFHPSETAYIDQGVNVYSGDFIYNNIIYNYNTGGIGSNVGYTYQYAGSDCSGYSNYVYTYSSPFNISSTGYSNICLSERFTGYFTYSGNTYYYNNNGIGEASSCPPPPPPTTYPYSGTDCGGGNVTIYTINSMAFAVSDTAYINNPGTTQYNGYFIYGGNTYYYSEGIGSATSCPTTTLPPTTTTITPTTTIAPSYTEPNSLRADIHANYETGSGAWQIYRSNVVSLFTANSGTNQSDYRDHVIREFNRKISILNQPTGLFISPYDDGFRFTGVSI